MNKQSRQSAIETISVSMDGNLVAALGRWRMAQQPVPSETDAIELLLVLALTYEGIAIGQGEPLPVVALEDPQLAQLVEVFRSASKRSKT